jgi:hypothetical protein
MPGLACVGVLPSNQRSVRAMTYKMYGAVIASLGVIALMLGGSESFARSGATSHGAFTSAHSLYHRSFAGSLRHRRLNNAGTFWPAFDDSSYGSYAPSSGEPTTAITQAPSGDIRYTYDVPWDWAHRYPPDVTPSERPYVPTCPTEVVTVARHDGKTQTVNITRCF